MPLNVKQDAFCREYIIDLNATQAALRSGYSEKTAGSIGFDLLKKPEIRGRIQELMDERVKRVDRTADDVLRDLLEVMADAMQKINDRDGNSIMANHNAALKAIELEGKHRKMFTDKVELSGPDGGPIDLNLRVTFVD